MIYSLGCKNKKRKRERKSKESFGFIVVYELYIVITLNNINVFTIYTCEDTIGNPSHYIYAYLTSSPSSKLYSYALYRKCMHRKIIDKLFYILFLRTDIIDPEITMKFHKI